MRKMKVSVLIVGAGGCGLSAANFLTDLGIDALIVERHAATSHLPKAHYINQRTMEIYRHHRMADAVYAGGAPIENRGKIHWMTSLGGDGPYDRLTFAKPDGLGGGDSRAVYDLKGVTDSTNIPQLRLEPILADLVQKRRPGSVLFCHELIQFTQHLDGINAIIRDLEQNEDIDVHCDYMIAADAGKTVGPALGVSMVGPTGLGRARTVHFSADLSQYITDDTACMRVFLHPSRFGEVNSVYTGTLLTFGPKNWDRHSEEWAISWGYGPNDPDTADNDELLVKSIKDILNIDTPIKVLGTSRWEVHAVVADKFRVGRIFIAGDAAHKHSACAGLGLNSAIQDAHNLCWKLALVLKGQAPESLLSSYEPERRPVVERNAKWSLFCFSQRNILTASLGLVLGASKEHNEAQFAQLTEDTPNGESRRARVKEVFAVARVEYAAHDMEMGFNYPVGAVSDDGSSPPKRDPMGHNYTPTSRPGCRLPHAWLRCGDKPVSTHDLLPVGGFLLLTGASGTAWISAAERLAAETGVTFRAYQIGLDTSDVKDPSGAWAKVKDINDDGSVLVRPDGHIGFRAHKMASDAYGTLRDALRDILTSASVQSEQNCRGREGLIIGVDEQVQ